MIAGLLLAILAFAAAPAAAQNCDDGFPLGYSYAGECHGHNFKYYATEPGDGGASVALLDSPITWVCGYDSETFCNDTGVDQDDIGIDKEWVSVLVTPPPPPPPPKSCVVVLPGALATVEDAKLTAAPALMVSCLWAKVRSDWT